MNLHMAVAAFPGVIFFEFSRTVFSMCTGGIVLFLIGIWAARGDFARARGLDKVVELGNLCFAMPLAVFGALHLSAAQGLATMVPAYMPWRLFWAYFVGVALIAAALSIATKIEVRWSGFLFGCMMFIFVALMDLPGMLAKPHDRIIWTLMLRELSFGCGGWVLAGAALSAKNGRGRTLVTIGRIVIGIVAIFYGVEHFIFPLNVPGVPLEKFMPEWIPARMIISYLTGVILLVCGACILLAIKTRTAATYLGAWILLLVIFIYGPILATSLLDPSTDVKVEGLNYFFDTLLFAGTVLALAGAGRKSEYGAEVGV
jgi:uncharacterized membrane protein YphA (DoxX/SURF4 family)